MRLFALLNFQDVILYLFPTLIFILIFAFFLGFVHFKSGNSEAREETITYRFPDDIADRNAPMPLSMVLIIGGTLVWMLLYILITGLSGMAI